MSLTSYCVECDAPPGDCQHAGPRYLDPIVYQRTEAGWQVPDHERERWEHRSPIMPPPPKPEPTPIHRLVVELQDWVDLNPTLEAKLRNVYELDPWRTSRAAGYVIDQAKLGTSHNPGGLLMSKLRAIETKDPT